MRKTIFLTLAISLSSLLGTDDRVAPPAASAESGETLVTAQTFLFKEQAVTLDEDYEADYSEMEFPGFDGYSISVVRSDGRESLKLYVDSIGVELSDEIEAKVGGGVGRSLKHPVITWYGNFDKGKFTPRAISFELAVVDHEVETIKTDFYVFVVSLKGKFSEVIFAEKSGVSSQDIEKVIKEIKPIEEG